MAMYVYPEGGEECSVHISVSSCFFSLLEARGCSVSDLPIQYFVLPSSLVL